jgi:tetratricopeptide (TPR) repeat protein
MNKRTIASAFFVLGTVFAYGQDLNRGIELYNAKKYTEAGNAIRDVLRAEPENAQALYYLGLSLLGERKPAEAAAELQKADSIKPDQADTKVALARSYIDQKEYDKATAELDKAAKLDSGNKQLPYNRGLVAFLGREDYSAAANEFEEALKRDPGNGYSHYYAGMAYSKLKKPDKMVSHFQLFLKMEPDAPEAAKVRSFLRATM